MDRRIIKDEIHRVVTVKEFDGSSLSHMDATSAAWQYMCNLDELTDWEMLDSERLGYNAIKVWFRKR